MNILIGICKKILFYFNLNPILFSFFIIITNILLALLFVLLKSPIYKMHFPQNVEWCFFNNKFETIKNSDNFFSILKIKKEKFLENFKFQYPECHESICTLSQNHKSIHHFIYTLKVHFEIKEIENGYLCYFYPCEYEFLNQLNIPMMIDYDGKFQKTNIGYDSLIKDSKKIEFNKTDMWLYKDFLYIKNEFKSKDKMVTLFSPLMSANDLEIFSNKDQKIFMSHLDFPFIVLKRDSTINFISHKAIEFFQLPENNLHRIQDVINELRGKILPESLDFQNLKNNLVNTLKDLKEKKQFVFDTLQNYKLSMTATPLSEEIIITFHLKESINDNIQEDLKQMIQFLNDFIILQDYRGNYIDSNFLLQKPQNTSNMLNLFKEKLNIEINSVNKIPVMNNKFHLMIAPNKQNINTVRFMVYNSMEKIVKIFNNLYHTQNVESQEYSSMVKFLMLKIDTAISLLGMKKSVCTEAYNFIDFFYKSMLEIKEIIDFDKHLEIQCNIKEYITNVDEKILKIILYQIFILCFEYNFINKKIIIEKKEENLFIEVQNLPLESREEIQEIINMIYQSDVIPYLDTAKQNITLGIQIKILTI